MSQVELRALFYDKVLAFAAAEGLPVSMPNVPFKKPTKKDAVYLQVHSLPVAPSDILVCGESRHRWILQIDVCSREGTGEINNNEYAEKIQENLFPVNLTMVSASHNFQVMTPPTPAPALLDDAWYCTPVSFTVETIH